MSGRNGLLGGRTWEEELGVEKFCWFSTEVEELPWVVDNLGRSIWFFV